MPHSSINDFKTLPRSISIVENNADGADELVENIDIKNIPVIGITGPPGAGKSTLLNAIMNQLLDAGKKIGLILVDPSSPFNLGALLGDRLRLSQHFNNPNLFIRSLASRGSLGGLSDKIIEITEVMKAYPFDYIFIETVGVGQSEVEIAGLADHTIVALVPEAGDSIQAMKAGLMEIADLFVVNKADRPDAEMFYNNLVQQLHLNNRSHIPVLKTIAVESKGVKELIEVINNLPKSEANQQRKTHLLVEKTYRLIQQQRMNDVKKEELKNNLSEAMKQSNFSVYTFAKKYFQ